jgi:DNA repair protein RadC
MKQGNLFTPTYAEVMELAEQYVAEEKPKLNSPELVARFLKPLMKDLEQEEVWVLILDTRNQLKHFQMVTRGLLTTSQVHPREVFKPAIVHSGARIILAHNHPSGDPEPSKQDIAVTDTVLKAGEIIGIPLVDHMVIGHSQEDSSPWFVSLRQRGHCG